MLTKETQQRPSLRIAVIIAITLAFNVVVAGVAFAIHDANVIHACVAQPGSDNTARNLNGQANTGSVRIVDSEADCRAGETHVMWNVEGPTGPAGPQGPPGTDGQDGEDASLSLASQTCPDGESVTGFDEQGSIVCSGDGGGGVSLPTCLQDYLDGLYSPLACPGEDLRFADLSGADLRFADLSGADLSHAILFDADLTATDLSGANLPFANLSRASAICHSPT
jgi:hypothetical protein